MTTLRPGILLAALAFAAVLHPSAGSAAEPADENPVLELEEHFESGENLRLIAKSELPLYVGRKAGRVLDVLPAGQTLTVLAVDRYGLKVRGRGRNGTLTGWVGQKKAFAGNEKQLARLRAFYERQLEIEDLIKEKRPAIGMDLPELKRILGKPTTHMVGASKEGRTESLTWIIKQKVDLNELLDVGTDEDLLKREVEVGRVEVELAHGIAQSINMKVDGGAAEIPTVVPPISDPFGPAPKKKLAGK